MTQLDFKQFTFITFFTNFCRNLDEGTLKADHYNI